MQATAAARPTDDPLAAFRALCPAAHNWIYANIASRTVLPEPSRRAVDAIADLYMTGDGEKNAWAPLLPRARRLVAELIAARSDDEIAVTRNVSDGLNIVASALPMAAGDNVVLCAELEHPNQVFAWSNAARRGVVLREVAAVEGAIDSARIIAATDGRTRAVVLSSVTFVPGSRTAIAEIGRHCRQNGIFLMVDAVQSLGILRTDVVREGIDGLATSTSKGLLGVMGLGFLYVAGEWAERMHPAYLARYAVDDDTGHESERGGAFRLKPGALRFETGNYNWIGLAAAVSSMELLAGLGAERIEAQALRLAASLRDRLEAQGLPVYRAPAFAGDSHIVTVGRMGAGDTYTTNDSRLEAFAENLAAARVKFSIRRGLVRFGFHAYNNDDDVAAIGACAAR
jgi:selenocysteine lyase/cysteine desulfurase